MIRKVPSVLEIALPFIGIGIMIYYEICDTACAYLRGTLFNLDLKYVGIIFMGIFLIISIPLFSSKIPYTNFIKTMMLSGALGGEVLLIRFQIINAVFCPYCLTFALIMLILFVLQVRKMNYLLAAFSFLAGIIVFALFFRGSVLPLYSWYHFIYC